MNVDLPTRPQRRRRKLLYEPVTFENFCFLIRKDRKADLIKGVIYMHSPPLDFRKALFGFLFPLLADYAQHKELGTVLGPNAVARLGEHDVAEPDIMFIAKERQQIVKQNYVDGAPDLIVEILAPSTNSIIRLKKKNQYARFGVREYWLIDLDRLTAKFLRNNNGKWEPMPVTAEGIFHSVVISGFWLRLEWLFAEELPDPLETVTQILK